MIQIQRPGHYLDYNALDKPFREEAYKKYVAERREIPTPELRREVIGYEGKSAIGKFFYRMFSDEYCLLRIKAAKQVLEERVAQSQP